MVDVQDGKRQIGLSGLRNFELFDSCQGWGAQLFGAIGAVRHEPGDAVRLIGEVDGENCIDELRGVVLEEMLEVVCNDRSRFIGKATFGVGRREANQKKSEYRRNHDCCCLWRIRPEEHGVLYTQ